MKQFTSIYGCGPAMANKLYDSGYRTLNDLRDAYQDNSETLHKFIHIEFDRFKAGLTYFDDLVNKKIKIDECQWLYETFKAIIHENIDKECKIDLMGGFKRGKTIGHDIDLLITHPTLGEEKHILGRLLELLEERNLVLYGKRQKESEHDWTSKKVSSKNKFDNFERFICVLRVPLFKSPNESNDHESQSAKRMKVENDSLRFDKDDKKLNEILESLDATKFKRDWIARRIDFIITPIDQHPFAVLGWTGSRQFVRSIRLYCDKEFNYRLSSHGLFDFNNNVSIKANSEEEIFDILKLKYIKPDERNC